jgi:hypothetical protein
LKAARAKLAQTEAAAISALSAFGARADMLVAAAKFVTERKS